MIKFANKLKYALTTITVISAQASGVFASVDGEYRFEGDWTDSFNLIDGSKVVHTPRMTTLGSISSSANIMLTKSLKGLTFNPCGLVLKTNSTREEFIAALIASGIYKAK